MGCTTSKKNHSQLHQYRNSQVFSYEFDDLIKNMNSEITERPRLRDLDCFILDNSLRESTVGQLRGHTLENKFQIYEQVKKCGFKHMIVAAFAHMPRVEDVFLKELELMESGEDMSFMYAFTEITEGVKNGKPDTVNLPIGFEKMKKFKLRNPILEIDLADPSIHWDNSFSIYEYADLIIKWIKWTHEHLCKDALVFINFRDFPIAMNKCPQRVFIIIATLFNLSSTCQNTCAPSASSTKTPLESFSPRKWALSPSPVGAV
jgi:hypothetical protein